MILDSKWYKMYLFVAPLPKRTSSRKRAKLSSCDTNPSIILRNNIVKYCLIECRQDCMLIYEETWSHTVKPWKQRMWENYQVSVKSIKAMTSVRIVFGQRFAISNVIHYLVLALSWSLSKTYAISKTYVKCNIWYSISINLVAFAATGQCQNRE